MLSATATISDKHLEPTDSTRLTVTISNNDSTATAENVQATICLKGGDQPGLELLPDDRSFGDIGPCESVSKEFAIITERATPETEHDVNVVLSFNVSHQIDELETVSFRVDRD